MAVPVCVFGCSLADQTSQLSLLKYTSYRTLSPSYFIHLLLQFDFSTLIPFAFLFTFNFFYYILVFFSSPFLLLIPKEPWLLRLYSFSLCLGSLCRLCNHKLIVLQMVSTRQISPALSLFYWRRMSLVCLYFLRQSIVCLWVLLHKQSFFPKAVDWWRINIISAHTDSIR